METETSFIMMDAAPSISTITYFDGDHASAARFLRERVALIIEKNQWLQGRLTQGGYLNLDEAKDDIFQHSSAPLSRSTPYSRLAQVLAPYLVKNGTNSVGRADEPLFKVCVLPDADRPTARWALVVSMSHVIADGHTFYQVHNMLSEEATMQSLNPQRKPHVMKAASEAMGGDDGFLGRPKLGLLLSLLTATAMGKLVGPACEAATYEVDEAFVSQQKATAKAEGGVAFVSTNDVITSTICRATGADVGTMDVNFRGKIEGCEPSDAGNYEDKIVYRPSDFSSPTMIRRSILDNGRLRRVGPSSLPSSVLDFYALHMITSVSNWSTFARDIKLDGHTPELHLPLFDPAAVPARFFTGCFVFRARPGGRLGLALAGSSEQLRAIERSGLVGAKIGVK